MFQHRPCPSSYTDLGTTSSNQTALFGVGYISAIATALNIAGHNIATEDEATLDEDGDVHVYTKLSFAGGFLSCLFWVRYVVFYAIYLSVCPSVCYLSVCPSVCCLSVCLSIHIH